MTAVREAKQAMRAEIRARIAAMRGLERSFRAARACATALRAPPLAGVGVVLAYRALADEVDPAPIVAALAHRGWRVAYPVVEGDGRLVLAEVRADGADPTTLPCWSTGRFGIEVPVRGHRLVRVIRPTEVDALLVPGRAFDATGARLGRGKGFYDGLLGRLRPHARRAAIGLAFGAQVVERVPTEAADRPVAWVASDRGLLRARRAEAPPVRRA